MATEYTILYKDEKTWIEAEKPVSAASAKAAVAAFVKGNGAKGGEYVAVPSRSFSPIKVTVETSLKYS